MHGTMSLKLEKHTYLHHCYQSTHKNSGTVEQTFMKCTRALYSLSRHLKFFCENQTILVILHNTVQIFLHASSVLCAEFLLQCKYFK